MNPYQVYYTNTNVDPEGIEDNYIPYNKPYGVMSWLQDVKPAGDYFLIVDPDMTFHRQACCSHVGGVIITRTQNSVAKCTCACCFCSNIVLINGVLGDCMQPRGLKNHLQKKH